MNYCLEVIGSNTNIPRTLQVTTALLLGTITFLSLLLVAGLSYMQLPKVAHSLFDRVFLIENQESYQKVIEPHQGWLNWIIIVSVVDIITLSVPTPNWLGLFEFPLSLLVAVNISFLGFSLLEELFDNYLLSIALDNKRKINSELLVIARFICNSLILLIVVSVFAQIHQINILGLIASLGIGGVAVAFASQKILEQLYIDSPMTI